MNEWKLKDRQFPNKNCRTQDEKMCWIINFTKKTMGVIFNIKNSQLVTFTDRQKRLFRYTAKSGLWQIFQLSIFVFSREKCHYQSHWIHNFRFLFWYYGPRKFQKQPRIENGEGFAVHSSSIVYFRGFVTAFLRAGNPCITLLFIW